MPLTVSEHRPPLLPYSLLPSYTRPTKGAVQLRLEAGELCNFQYCDHLAVVLVKSGPHGYKLCVQEAMEQRMVEVASQAQESHDLDEDRYARLKELREKLAVSGVSKRTHMHSI